MVHLRKSDEVGEEVLPSEIYCGACGAKHVDGDVWTMRVADVDCIACLRAAVTHKARLAEIGYAGCANWVEAFKMFSSSVAALVVALDSANLAQDFGFSEQLALVRRYLAPLANLSKAVR